MGWKPTYNADSMDPGAVSQWTFVPGYEAPWDTAATFAAIPEPYKAQALERITRNYWGSDANQILQQIVESGVPRETALENLYQAYRTNPAMANAGLSPAEIKVLGGFRDTPESIAQNQQWVRNDQAAKSVDNDSALSALLNSGFMRVAGLPFAVGGIQSGLAKLLGEGGPLTYSADTGAGAGGVNVTYDNSPVTGGLADWQSELANEVSPGMPDVSGPGTWPTTVSPSYGSTVIPTTTGMPTGEFTRNVIGNAAGGAAGTAAARVFGGSGEGATTEARNIFGNAAGSAAGAGAASALARIIDGTATTADWLSVGGTLGATGLGIAGASSQASALRDLAAEQKRQHDEAVGFGAPYRTRLADLYANPDAFLTSKEVTTPVQTGLDAAARSLSVSGGNPFGSGNAWQALTTKASQDLFGRLGTEKDRLAGFGGLTAYNAAGASPLSPAASIAATNASGRMFGDLGGAIGTLTAPEQQNDIFGTRNTLADLLRRMGGGNAVAR